MTAIGIRASDPMNRKIVAVAAVLVVVVAAAAVAVVCSDDDSEAASGMSIISNVNTEGSGLYVRADYEGEDFVSGIVEDEPSSGYYLGAEGAWVVLNRDAWGGQVFACPGPATTQFVLLQRIAAAMDLEFEMYTVGLELSDDTLYYIPNITTYSSFISNSEIYPVLTGAIAWEAQYSAALIGGCQDVITTNELFPGHICCVMGATNEYLAENPDLVVRFLAAYIEAADRLEAALEAGEGDDYEALIETALTSVTIPDTLSDDEKVEALLSALYNITFSYTGIGYDGEGDPLEDLVSEVASLSDSLYEGGNIDNSYSDLGFASSTEFAEKFVDSSYLVDALQYEGGEDYEETTTIVVAVNVGDIHQIPLHYAVTLGIFEEYGITIELSHQTSGPGVYAALTLGSAAGGADIGILGACPMTIYSMNEEQVSPD